MSKLFYKRGAPFDRHDWVVDRCGLEQVRYVIDYYDDENWDGAGADLDISLDTRPALDSFQAAFDRIRYPIYKILYGDLLSKEQRAAAMAPSYPGKKT